MRLLPILLCLALAGCVTDGGAGDVVSGSNAQASAQQGQQASPPSGTAPQASAAKPAAKKDDKKEDWWKEGGVTREKVSAMCWMKYEQGRKDMPVEKRADLVNKCVEDTLKEHPVGSGTSAAATPAPSRFR